MIFAVTAVFNRAGAVDVTCGSVLYADHLVICKIINSLDIRIFGNDDDLYAGRIGLGEVDVLLALFSDSQACHSDVGLAALNGSDDRTELHVVNYEFKAELLSDQGSDLNVDSLESAVVGDHLVGRECSVCSHVKLTGFNSLDFRCSFFSCGSFCFGFLFSGSFSCSFFFLSLSGSCGSGRRAAACRKRKCHYACKKQCKILFHGVSSLNDSFAALIIQYNRQKHE